MIDIETIDKIYLYPGSTDLRKGMQAIGDSRRIGKRISFA